MISLTYNTPFLFTIFLCINISAGSAIKSCGTFSGYTPTTFFLCDGKTLIASHGEMKFELGFFTPKGNFNKSKYLGIWYLDDPETVVWVANRNRPLPENSAGSFGVPNNVDGKLQIWDEKGNSYFSTDLKPSESFDSRTARLLDNGNLLLSDEISGKTLWQSFDHPTDTFLPGMNMSENLKLTSWTSRDDPFPGNFRFEQGKVCGYTIMNKSIKYWETCSDRPQNFINRNKMYDGATYLLNKYENNNNYPVTKPPPYRSLNASLNPLIRDLNKTRLLMSSSGEIEYFKWVSVKKIWLKIWSEPQTLCSVYNICGKFGICSTVGKILCKCVPGFEPAVPEAWNSGDYSCGCNRKSTLCGKEKNYTFVELKVINVEDPSSESPEIEEDEHPEDICKEECLENKCQCQAYSYWYRSGTNGSRNAYACYIWTADLADLQVGYAPNDERNIYIKIQSGASVQNQLKGTRCGNKSLPLRVVIILITTLIAVVLLTGSISYIYYRRMVAKRQESRKDVKENTVLGLCGPPRQFSEEDKQNIDVPFFDLETILAATDSFSDANKLGQGGFGPVYKGIFSRGQEIAVKRLSVRSTQGVEELKNEVVLIAKLQHRNLVRLLGYCIEGDENILLYEYMPNKSLDAFIFDQTLCVLNWEKRFEIILGIARGLLYLHQDSRLRVIHRDLKVSNILLDEDMNPKISDFGLARIVRGGETIANTNKIVGTYGYMSPEYALNGLFSIKSDVFSFGVIVLEIISGKRNTGFYKSEQDLNLLCYAWRLWKEDKQLDMMDQKIVECCNKSEVLKCILIGLLCVQEDPDERPTMSNILVMLGSSTEIENLPGPKQPAFVARANQQTVSNVEQTQSNNGLTLSALEGR